MFVIYTAIYYAKQFSLHFIILNTYIYCTFQNIDFGDKNYFKIKICHYTFCMYVCVSLVIFNLEAIFINYMYHHFQSAKINARYLHTKNIYVPPPRTDIYTFQSAIRRHSHQHPSKVICVQCDGNSHRSENVDRNPLLPTLLYQYQLLSSPKLFLDKPTIFIFYIDLRK
jgi:hypothetical protein